MTLSSSQVLGEMIRPGITLIWQPPGDAFQLARCDECLGVRPWFIDLGVPGYRVFQINRGGAFAADSDRYFLELRGKPVAPTKYRVCLPPRFHIDGIRYFGMPGYEIQLHAPITQFIAPVDVRQFLLNEQENFVPVTLQVAQPVTFVEVVPTQPEGEFVLGLYFWKITDTSRCHEGERR